MFGETEASGGRGRPVPTQCAHFGWRQLGQENQAVAYRSSLSLESPPAAAARAAMAATINHQQRTTRMGHEEKRLDG